MDSSCKECKGDNYVLLGCCNGQECGCMGQPVALTNCTQCNPKGEMEMGEYIKQYEMLEYVPSYTPETHPDV